MKRNKIFFFTILTVSLVSVVIGAWTLGSLDDPRPLFKRSCNLTKPKFEDYPIKASDWYLRRPASVDFSGQPEAWSFRTIIRSAVLRGVNFAGTYVVAEWGCGTSCQNHALVDAKTGRIIVSGLISSHGLDYRKNSNLLIVNPRSDNWSGTNDTNYYTLEDGKLKLLCGPKSTLKNQ